jgi:hypothetical protein
MNVTLTRLNWRTAARVWVGLLVLLGVLPGLHAIILPPVWRWSNPAPHGANVYDMACIGGTYVQVCECGQIFTSADAQTWVPCESGITLALRAITLLGGRVVITGENGAVIVSDDLTDFYSAGVNTTNWLEGVAASSNTAVTVGDNAATYVSTNGVSWQPLSGLPFNNNWLSGIAYGTNSFVVAGESGLIATSPNGTTWTARTSGTTIYLNGVAWVSNQFLAVGEGGTAFTSPSGTTWQAVTTGATNALYDASGTTNSLLVAGELELRLWGTANWSNELSTALLSPAPSWPYYATLWDGAGYFAAGSTGLTTESYQTNGTTQWYTETNSLRIWLWQVAHPASNYIAVGDFGTILTSPNGIDWDVELTPSSATNSVLLGVGGSTNFFLAVGSQGTVLWATNTFLWNALPAPTTNDLQGVCFDGSRFILCGGNGTLLTSTNGTNWTQRATPANAFLMSVTTFNRSWVAVGEGGVILTSLDSTNWVRQTSGTTNWLSQVRCLNGQLLALGETGTILVSTNGTNWAARTSGLTNWLNAADYVDGVWFIAGDQGTLLISTDTTNWINSGTITLKSLYGLVIYQGQLVTVGTEGVIIRSQLIPATTPVNISSYARVSGEDIFLFTGQADQQFYLNSSTNLSTWSQGPLLEFLDSSGTLLYVSSVATNAPQQFFRTVLAY